MHPNLVHGTIWMTFHRGGSESSSSLCVGEHDTADHSGHSRSTLVGSQQCKKVSLHTCNMQYQEKCVANVFSNLDSSVYR